MTVTVGLVVVAQFQDCMVVDIIDQIPISGEFRVVTSTTVLNWQSALIGI